MNRPGRRRSATRRYEAILFDLLSGLLDSWSLWDRVAGSVAAGRRWRLCYLDETYAAGRYRDYLSIVGSSAGRAGLPTGLGVALADVWDEVEPWPEAAESLSVVSAMYRIGVVTNCSESLARRAARRVGTEFVAVVSAQACGWYKPAPAAYLAGLEALRTAPQRTLFVAGSPRDVAGATAVGMDVLLHDRAGLASRDIKSAASAVISTLQELPDWLGLPRRS